MTLLSPWALALLAVALPILWLLHRRKRAILMPVSNLFLWQEAADLVEVSSSPRRRERDWLLVLDTAILLALVVALARPARLASEGRSVAIVLDLSLSMSALETGGTRLDLAREKAEAFLESLGPDDAVMVVAGSSTPRIVQELTRDRNAARVALRRLEPSAGGARLGDAIGLALSKLGSGSDIVLFSDGAKGASVPAALDLPSVRYLDVGETSDNVAIARLAARRNVSSPFDGEVYVEVRSFSEKERSVPLRLADGTGVFLDTRLRIPPRGSRSASVRRAFRNESVIEATIEAGDALALDDRAYAVVGPEAPISVLLVTAGSPFLEAALSSHAAIRLTIVKPEEYLSGSAPSDVVVFDRTLEGAREEGSTLVIYPPEPMADAQLEPIEVRDSSHPVLGLVDFGGLGLGAASSVVSSPGDRVLAAAGGRPVLVAGVSERGRRVGLSGELLSNGFPLSPSFPILVSNAIEWMRMGVDDDSAALVAGERGDVPDRPGVYSVRRDDRTRRVAVLAPVDSESDIARVERAPKAAPGGAGIHGEARPRAIHAYLLLASVLLLLAERRFAPLGLAWAALLVSLLALIGPAIPIGRRAEPLVVALDSSESVSEDSRLRTLERISEWLEIDEPRGETGLVVFGRDAWIEQALGPAALSTKLGSEVDRNASNLEAGLRLAGTMLGGGDGGRIVLASDGNETLGEAVRTAAALRSRGLTVDVIPLEASAAREAKGLAAVDVNAPSLVRLGEPFEVAVTIAGRPGARGALELRRDDGSVSKREIALERDRDVVGFTEIATSSGAHSYEVHPGAGVGALVWASGRPRILHVSQDGQADGLTKRLERQGFDVESMLPSRVPQTPAALSGYDAVLFADVPARSFRASQMISIAEYVERTGGGFVMAGGASSFGPGGYAGTPLDPVLPLEVRSGGGPGQESVGVVLVIDKSGSMGVDETGISKIQAAAAAAVGIERLLASEDVLGAIAFDREPQTILPLRRVGSGDALALSSLHSLGPRGATFADAAIALACSWLRGVEVSERLVLLVSDGQFEDEDYQRVVELFRSGDVTLSAVGIGADADRERLEALARAGGGEAIFVPISEASPEFLASEAVRLSRDWKVERETSIRARERHPIARGIDFGSLPRLSGYVPTSKRENAATILTTEREEPILAAWQAGVGRSLALTSAGLANWDSFDRLWLQAVRWTARGPEEGALHPRAEISDRRVRVRVDAYGEDGWFFNGLEVRARVRPPSPGADLLEISLDQTAPGRYEGSFDLGGPGAYLLRASAEAPGGDWEDSVQFGVYASAAPELREAGPDLPLLHEIARSGGGRVLDGAEELSGTRKARSASLGVWRALTALAVLVFLAHVARRTGAWPRPA